MISFFQQTLGLLGLCLLPTVTYGQACYGNPTIAGHCTPLTWVNTTTSSSPSVSDCSDACRMVSTDAGDFVANFTGRPDSFRDDVVLGKCGFSVARGSNTTELFQLDNQDILDIYYGSIQRFSEKGRVSANGTMTCEGQAVKWYMG